LDIRPEGITLFDTADTYSPSGGKLDIEHMETILFEIFDNVKALIATKGGMMRLNEESNGWRPLHSSKSFKPEDFKDLVQESLKRLTKEMKDKKIFLYQIHHMDDERLIEVIKVLKKVRDEEGTIQHLGLCNIKNLDLLKKCINAVQSTSCSSSSSVISSDRFIVSVQNKFSPLLGPTEMERQIAILDWCEENDFIYQAYAPFGGLDARRGTCVINKEKFPILCATAEIRKCSPHVMLLAYFRHKWPKVNYSSFATDYIECLTLDT
jgi:aryl-alcohol dehydrogenase-like predicted oxidoreductase